MSNKPWTSLALSKRCEELATRAEKAEAEVERLTETLDDWRRSATLAAEETCGAEKHCTCVGVLRKVLQEARDALSQWKDRHDALLRAVRGEGE